MPGRLGPRFALEAAFLILLAVGAGLADLSPTAIVLVMVAAWVIVAVIEFTAERGGASTVLRGSPPSRPGAFRVDGVPPAAGLYRWALVIGAPGLTDRHELGSVTVFPDEASAKAEVEKRPADDPAAIAYADGCRAPQGNDDQWIDRFCEDVLIKSGRAEG